MRNSWASRNSVVGRLVALLLTAPVAAAAAQHPFTGAAELSLGNALGYGPGAQYDNQSQLTARIAIGGRIALTNRTGIFADVDAELVGIAEGDKVCIVVGPAGCAPEFPNFGGQVLLMGLSQHVRSRIDLRAGIGPGFYDIRNYSAHTTAFVASADATVDLVSHVGINVAVRDILFNFRAQQFQTIPITVGLRIH